MCHHHCQCSFFYVYSIVPFDNGRSIDTTFILVGIFRRVFRAMDLSTSIEPLIGPLVFFPGDAVAAFREAGSKVPSLRPLGCGPTRFFKRYPPGNKHIPPGGKGKSSSTVPWYGDMLVWWVVYIMCF